MAGHLLLGDPNLFSPLLPLQLSFHFSFACLILPLILLFTLEVASLKKYVRLTLYDHVHSEIPPQVPLLTLGHVYSFACYLTYFFLT
jgi:hypothetical protein